MGVLVLRPSLKLGRDCVMSEAWGLDPRSVEDRAAGLGSAVVGNTGVVELRPPLAVRLLGLRTGSWTSKFAEVVDVGGRLRSSV